MHKSLETRDDDKNDLYLDEDFENDLTSFICDICGDTGLVWDMEGKKDVKCPHCKFAKSHKRE